MATKSYQGICSKCGNEEWVSTCSGCFKMLCSKDLKKHVEDLKEQCNKMRSTCGSLIRSLVDPKNKLSKNATLMQIDEWEKNAIKQIQKRAEEARNYFKERDGTHLVNMKNQLEQFIAKLEHNDRDMSTFELNLSRLNDEQKRLMETMCRPPDIIVHADSVPLVMNISIHTIKDTIEPNDAGKEGGANDKGNRQSDRSHTGQTEQNEDKKKEQRQSNESSASVQLKSDQRNKPNSQNATRPSKINTIFYDTDDEKSPNRHSLSKWDVREYRENYPYKKSDSRLMKNYNFYANKSPCLPDNCFIDDIHIRWFGDVERLENSHGYIQWLFPIQEMGLNYYLEPLQKHEIELIKKDPQALRRLRRSYKLMLDFYGFELLNKETGEIRRLPNEKYISRFHNLNTSFHNYLRITRILKCLGEFDYEHYKFPFLETILQEIITNGTLPNCLESCRDYWIETLRSQDERRAMRKYANQLIKYHNNGEKPPASHRAVRPSVKEVQGTK